MSGVQGWFCNILFFRINPLRCIILIRSFLFFKIVWQTIHYSTYYLATLQINLSCKWNYSTFLSLRNLLPLRNMDCYNIKKIISLAAEPCKKITVLFSLFLIKKKKIYLLLPHFKFCSQWCTNLLYTCHYFKTLHIISPFVICLLIDWKNYIR